LTQSSRLKPTNLVDFRRAGQLGDVDRVSGKTSQPPDLAWPRVSTAGSYLLTLLTLLTIRDVYDVSYVYVIMAQVRRGGRSSVPQRLCV